MKSSPTNSLDRAFHSKSKIPFFDISTDLGDFLSTLRDLVNILNDFACVSSSDVVIAAEKLKSNLADNLSSKLTQSLKSPHIASPSFGMHLRASSSLAKKTTSQG
jgi:hypothetical protein